MSSNCSDQHLFRGLLRPLDAGYLMVGKSSRQLNYIERKSGFVKGWLLLVPWRQVGLDDF